MAKLGRINTVKKGVDKFLKNTSDQEGTPLINVPLTRRSRNEKRCMKLLKNENGKYFSMLQCCSYQNHQDHIYVVNWPFSTCPDRC